MIAAEAAEVPAVRHGVRSHLAALELPAEVIEVAELLVSELMTNALRHGRVPIRCLVTQAGPALRIEVFDGGNGAPSLRAAALDEESGRGLHLVEKLSSRWGWQATENGKCTWVEIDLNCN